MAPRTRVSRRPRRMGLKKAKRVLGKRMKRMAKSNQDNEFKKLVMEFQVTPTLTPSQPNIKNYISVQQPLAAFDAAVSNCVYNIPEYQLYCNQFDRVRINSVKITWQPRVTQAIFQDLVQSQGWPQNGDLKWHTAIDRDSKVTTGIPRMQRMSSYRNYSIFKKFSRTYSIKYPRSYWLNTAAASLDDNTLQALGGLGYVGIYAENLPFFQTDDNPIWFGSFKVEFNCVFQGKNIQSISVADNGSVTILPHGNLPIKPTTQAIPLSVYDTLELETDYNNGEIPPCVCEGPTGPTGPEGVPK